MDAAERPEAAAPRTRFQERISAHRRVAFGSLSLDEVKAVKNAHGVHRQRRGHGALCDGASQLAVRARRAPGRAAGRVRPDLGPHSRAGRDLRQPGLRDARRASDRRSRPARAAPPRPPHDGCREESVTSGCRRHCCRTRTTSSRRRCSPVRPRRWCASPRCRAFRRRSTSRSRTFPGRRGRCTAPARFSGPSTRCRRCSTDSDSTSPSSATATSSSSAIVADREQLEDPWQLIAALTDALAELRRSHRRSPARPPLRRYPRCDDERVSLKRGVTP